MANVRSFHGKKSTKLWGCKCTYVEEEKPEAADIVMTGPSLVDQETDLENENDSSLCNCQPNEVSCKLEVFSIHNEDLSNNDESDDSSITYISCSPSSKKAKKGTLHKVVKWEKEHLNPKPTSKPEQHKSLSTFAGMPW